MKNKIMLWLSRGSILCIVLLATGCADYYIKKLEKTEPVGYEFTKALKKEYLEFAKSEANVFLDDIHAAHFAYKGLQTADTGINVLPENPYRWDLSDEKKKELMEQRERLMLALSKSGRRIAPEVSAKAQVSFDCWVEQEEEGFQPEDINACKTGFMTSIVELEKMVDDYAPIFKIYFDLNKSTVTEENKSVVKNVYNVMKHLNLHKVALYCYADGVGGRNHNLKLTQDRAEAAKKTIVEAGLPEHLIDIALGSGEAKGTKEIEPTNRRCDFRIH